MTALYGVVPGRLDDTRISTHKRKNGCRRLARTR